MSVVEEQNRIVTRFLDARRAAAGLSDFPGELPVSLDGAYRLQDEAIARWERPVLGWKVGRIHPPLSDRLGADRLAGPIFNVAQAGGEPAAMPVFAEGFAAVEAEFLLRVGDPPPADKASFSREEAARHIDAVHVGIEIASSPLPSINDIGALAVVSDFGNNNGLVVGPPVPNWRDSGFEAWDVSTFIDGAVAGTGRAAAFPDGALGAAAFLFSLMARRGIALRTGQWISSGAVTGVHDVRPDQAVTARFADGLSVECLPVAARAQLR